jgi:entericidin B
MQAKSQQAWPAFSVSGIESIGERKMKWMTCMVMLALLSLTACNTVEGMGKDIEKAGEAIQKTSK